MKVLLRAYGNRVYVWKTAKYNRGHFVVDECEQAWCNVVAVINDNRKKYVQCSSCGQTFRKGDPKFEEHKANAIKPETCFECEHLFVDDSFTESSKFFVRPDGTIGEKVVNSVRLSCTFGRCWAYPRITSDDAINSCSKRKCANATATEIKDFFTEYPGAFDDIITIDRLLDAGYDVGMTDRGDSTYDIEYNEDYYTIGATINKIGIVDRFYLWFEGDKYEVYYSKRYNKLFTVSRGDYVEWKHPDLTSRIETEIKTKIKNLYY